MAKVRNVPPTIPRYKRFGNTRYVLDEVYTTHAEALRQMKDWRSMGHPARVVKSCSWYLVYYQRR